MSKVDREEHIKRLKAYKECRKKQVKGIWEECNSYLCDNCKLCYEQGNAGEHISTIKKAISDMEKLQKIEKVYKEYNILCSSCPADRERGECNDCLVYNLEKVFEGE